MSRGRQDWLTERESVQRETGLADGERESVQRETGLADGEIVSRGGLADGERVSRGRQDWLMEREYPERDRTG